jgi:LPXTG-site transpeptidase (sortase) family protein
MRLSTLTARARGPVLVTLSALAIAGAYLPAGVAAPVPTIRRVIAKPVEIPVFTPHSISIPEIDVKAPIVPVWTESDGKMASPGGAHDVGWWAGRKAGKGNLLLDGHHDWNGVEGTFYRLGDLKRGDDIIVKGKKHELTYRVIWVKNYDRLIDATDLLGNKGKPQIATLITCGGTFDTIARTHRERVVVRAELVTT